MHSISYRGNLRPTPPPLPLLYYSSVVPAPLCVLANVASGLWWNRGPYPFVGHLVFSTLHCTGCLSAKRYEKRYEKYHTTIVVALSSGWAYDDVHKNLARILHSCAMMNCNDQSRSCHPEPFAALRINSAKDLCAHRARPFAALRVTQHSRSWL